MTLNDVAELDWTADSLDYNVYIITLSDSIDTEMFYGKIYVNYQPKIISRPKEAVHLGETFVYQIKVEDKNKISPNNEKTENII